MVHAVFGGSFDPPHIGHVLAVHYVLTVGWVEGVVVVPVFRHAFDKASTPFAQRLALCESAFDGVPGVEVSAIERGLPAPSYTLRTIEALSQVHPGRTWRLLMGSDLVADAERWHRFDELRQLAPPIILARAGYPVDREVETAPPVLPQVSSSQLRHWLRRPDDAKSKGELVAFLPARVRELIAARNLYR